MPLWSLSGQQSESVSAKGCDLRFFSKTDRPSARQLKRRIAESGLFDPIWYRQRYLDVARSGQQPLDHFIRHGRYEGREPGPLFCAEHYIKLYGPRMGNFEDALTHYLFTGKANGFDGALFMAPTGKPESIGENKEQEPLDASLAEHTARSDQLIDSGLWDAKWYLANYPDLNHAGVDPLLHFLSFGSLERRSPSGLFNATWYYNEYLLAQPTVEPLFHYLDIGIEVGHKPQPGDLYEFWLNCYNELRPGDFDRINSAIDPLHVVTVIYLYKTASDLQLFIASLKLQEGVAWKLKVLDRSGSRNAERKVLATEVSAEYIKGSLSALCQIVDSHVGEHLVIVEADVVLRPHCLAFFAIEHMHDRDLLYANEDVRTKSGLSSPLLKPAHSPRLFSQLNSAFGCFSLHDRNRRVAPCGTMLERSEVEWTTNLFLRLSNNITPSVVESVTYSRSVRDRPKSSSINSETISSSAPSVSIIIPIKDKIQLLIDCLDSINTITRYSGRLDIIIVDNGSSEESTLEYLREGEIKKRFRLIRNDSPFNYSRLNNIAAVSTDTEIILFLNNDTVVNNETWLSLMVRELMDDGVAFVGAKLLYPDRTVQHAGIVLGIQGIAGHAFSNIASNEPGYYGLNLHTREVTANTGACLAVRRSVFFELGGFNPSLEVAFNDVALCVAAIKAGYRNIWVHDAVLFHHESKSRGYDTTARQKEKFLSESIAFRRDFWKFDDVDRYYSRNLSLHAPYELAWPPRRERMPFALRRPDAKRRVLLLSSTYQVGHGVAVVIEQHVKALLSEGYEVVLGGSHRAGEMEFPGALRLFLDDARSAAQYAVRYDIDCVIAHTPPYFSVVRHIAKYPAVILYDYGEPDPGLFPDFAARIDVNNEKRLCFTMSRFKAAISNSVRAESGFTDAYVIPLANSHLGSWSSSSEAVRSSVRSARKWHNKFVVLNVCRFTKGERSYKGIDGYIDLFLAVTMIEPNKEIIFVMCGKGQEEDVRELKELGLTVVANPCDKEIAEIYTAADLYVNLSKWEGYNLGIAQALAMGLPVLASSIEAHRAFPIFCSNRHDDLVKAVLSEMREPSGRNPVIYKWDESMVVFKEYVNVAIAIGRDEYNRP